MAPRIFPSARAPRVIVVDPAFEAYGDLAAAARDGRIDLHFRTAGAVALRLADSIDADAWIVAPELDDMSGADFIELLRARTGTSVQACVPSQVGDWPRSDGDVPILAGPVTRDEITAVLGAAAAAPVEKTRLAARFVALQAVWIGLTTSLVIFALRDG